MSRHEAKISWNKTSPEFLQGRYSREHSWEFDGGVSVPASPSPSAVPAPYSNAANVDPEEAYVAAIASCHMLTFLHLASKAGIHVEEYEDDAVGETALNAQGAHWVSQVTLHPKIRFAGTGRPADSDLRRLHREAHEQCYIANSVRTRVVVEAVP